MMPNNVILVGFLVTRAIPNLTLRSAGANPTLVEKSCTRIMERAQIDCWHDGNIMGLAMMLFTSTYAIVRYDVSLNGSEPHSNIVMYLLDKGCYWTAPYAGNILALGSIYQKWPKFNFCPEDLKFGPGFSVFDLSNTKLIALLF